MDYIEIGITCSGDATEILMAEMDGLDAESMMETTYGFNAYFPGQVQKDQLDAIITKYRDIYPFSYTMATIKQQNWNKVWESNFSPVEVGRCRVRATFHEADPTFDIELVIEPKMSFGTGHHETTSLMIATQLEMDFAGKSVLDCGYGTGILSILSKKLGARRVDGTEIDPWCIENARENEVLNDESGIGFRTGDVSILDDSLQYDIVLANINKNVLLQEIPAYATHLKVGGTLVLSGFYESDLPDIKDKCTALQLQFIAGKSKNSWVAASFTT